MNMNERKEDYENEVNDSGGGGGDGLSRVMMAGRGREAVPRSCA